MAGKVDCTNKKQKICITGDSGFFGRNLTNELSSVRSLELIRFHGDLLKKSDIEDYFNNHGDIDQIVHLVGLFSGSFEKLISINVIALANLLEVALSYGVKKIIFTSSGAVYGESPSCGSKETDELKPNTAYGLSKKMAEDVLHFYYRYENLKVIVLRFPNVYGPGSDKGVIYSFLRDIEEKKQVTIYGDGSQCRNFLHIKDACKALNLAISYTGSGVFNITNPKKVSINELIDTLKNKYCYEFVTKYEPSNNKLANLLLDSSLAKRELGFEAEFEDIILNNLKWNT